MVNIGAADARKFANTIKEMVEAVRKLGPAQAKNDKKPQEISS
jgi:coenzyme F420-reducing hydrogenase delta subunit